jgi:hypothetical protein
MNQAATQMPLYVCHKQVWALKIKAIRQHDGESRFDGGSWLLDVEEPGYAPIEVSHHDYVLKHSPRIGGYYVIYKDGYQSFSPAKAFEDGYTPVVSVVPALYTPTFQGALAALKDGRRVARAGWNGKGMFAYMVPPAAYPVQTGAAKAHFGEGSLVPYNAYFALKGVDETVSTWVPSVSDLLAEDWHVIE